MIKEPETSAEWQEAVDLAAGALAILDCRIYGLITGGPLIDVARCDDVLKRGRLRGVVPSKPDSVLAVELAIAFNSTVES